MINKRKRGQEQARAELLSDNNRIQDTSKTIQQVEQTAQQKLTDEIKSARRRTAMKAREVGRIMGGGVWKRRLKKQVEFSTLIISRPQWRDLATSTDLTTTNWLPILGGFLARWQAAFWFAKLENRRSASVSDPDPSSCIHPNAK